MRPFLASGVQGGWGRAPCRHDPPTLCLAPPCLSLPWGSSSPGELQAQVPRGLWVPRVSGSGQWGWARRVLGTLSTKGQTMKASGTLAVGQGGVGHPHPFPHLALGGGEGWGSHSQPAVGPAACQFRF